jgi:hypothetical protein
MRACRRASISEIKDENQIESVRIKIFWLLFSILSITNSKLEF